MTTLELRAAASFYQTDYDAAIGQLKVIARDRDSEWRQTALLVIARAMIRRATIGQITELPAGARPLGNSPSSNSRSDALAAYQNHLAAMRPARLAEASGVLRSILADSTMASLHHSASGLLDLVELRANPAAQARVLEQRLSARDRSQSGGTFRQASIDLSYYVRQAEAGSLTFQQSNISASGPGLLAWLQAMATARTGTETEPLPGTSENLANKPAGRVYTTQGAFDAWRSTQATPWLVAALMAAQPGAPEVPKLLEAVTAPPHASPAFIAATYHRLRLVGGDPAGRSELDQLMPTILTSQSRSSINLFLALRQRSSPTLSAFLADAGKLPAGVIYETGDPLDLQTNSRDGLCHLSASEADTRLFDHNAATVLNTRMPLTLLADAAEKQILPINLQFQVAQATWTRALLLGRPEIAKRMSSILAGCYPAWHPWLKRYDMSNQEEDRAANGLLALMRFASNEPIVRDGEQRSEGFATYSSYRDNWWQESRVASPPLSPTATRTGRSLPPETFFGSVPASPAELPILLS